MWHLKVPLTWRVDLIPLFVCLFFILVECSMQHGSHLASPTSTALPPQVLSWHTL